MVKLVHKYLSFLLGGDFVGLHLRVQLLVFNEKEVNGIELVN